MTRFGSATARRALTVVQHMKTMMKVPMTPPIPTSQVILRKRITPKMFWMHGRKTPIRVPSWGAWEETRQDLIQTKSPNLRCIA